VAAPLSALALLLAGCSGGGASGPALSEEPSGPSTPRPVTVTQDVRFAAAAPERTRWSDPLLDVYAPVGGQGLPLVVFLPPHGLTKDSSPAYAQLATAIAEQGAVVAVANWTQLDDPPEILTEPEAFVEVSRLGQAVAGCAVSFAAEHAGDYGADPSRLVLAGELFGANAAGMIALGEPDTLPGCSSTAEWAATGLAGVNGLWMAAYPPFDDVAAAATASQTPWALLDAARPIPVALMVTEAGIAVSERCGGRDAEWLVARDPSGIMRTRLDDVGALDDACLDLKDEARAMAAELAAHEGMAPEVVPLANPDGATGSDDGAHLEQLGPADLALLTETVMGLAD